jgi:hypothetical protein
VDDDPWTSHGADFMLHFVSDTADISWCPITYSTFSELSHVMLDLVSYEGGWMFDADS